MKRYPQPGWQAQLSEELDRIAIKRNGLYRSMREYYAGAPELRWVSWLRKLLK